MVFGNNFSCNRHCFFACSKNITFGDNVLIGWNVNIRDSDGHKIYALNETKKDNSIKSVEIGNHVWIGSNVDILKGVKIQDDCIVRYNSCVTKKIINKNCIIAGYPAKIVKENVNWEN